MNEFKSNYKGRSKSSSNRNFGFVFSIVFFIISFYPLIYGNNIKLWSLLVSLIFFIISLVYPNILKPLNFLWTKIGLFLHHFISPIALGILFFIVVTPTGLIMRLFRKRPLQLFFDKKSETYWINRKLDDQTIDSFKNQF